MHGKGGPITATADGPGGPILAGDHRRRDRTSTRILQRWASDCDGLEIKNDSGGPRAENNNGGF